MNKTVLRTEIKCFEKISIWDSNMERGNIDSNGEIRASSEYASSIFFF